MENLENQPIEELDLSVRSWKCCKKYGIETIEDLMQVEDNELLINLCMNSKKVYNEIKAKLLTISENHENKRKSP